MSYEVIHNQDHADLFFYKGKLFGFQLPGGNVYANVHHLLEPEDQRVLKRYLHYGNMFTMCDSRTEFEELWIRECAEYEKSLISSYRTKS